MRWAELLKKGAEYARKSLEEIGSALRNGGNEPVRQFEPAYSKYRRNLPPLPPRPNNARRFHTQARPNGARRFITYPNRAHRFYGQSWRRFFRGFLPNRTSSAFFTSLDTPTNLQQRKAVRTLGIRTYMPSSAFRMMQQAFKRTQLEPQSTQTAFSASSSPSVQLLSAYRSLQNEQGVSISAALDFDLQVSVPVPEACELTDQTVASVCNGMEEQRARLANIMLELKKISEFGELPVSMEKGGSVLRVHFPNCDAERLHVLAAEKNIKLGRVVELELNTDNEFGQAADVSGQGSAVETKWEDVFNAVPDLTLSSVSSENSQYTPSVLASQY